MTSQKIGKVLLLIFYNSTIDFYYIAPFIYNLIRGIQFVLKTNNITANKVRRQYIDINTMISDTIALFNCTTRIKYNSYSYFLGNDSIYNESGFLHFKIFDDSIKRLIRKNFGDEDFTKVKNDNKQKTSENIFRDNQYEKQLETISFNNKKLISFHRKKKAKRLKEYLGREITIIFDDNDTTDEEKIENQTIKNTKFEEEKNYNKTINAVSRKKKKEKKGVDLLGLDMSVCNSDDDTYQKQKKSLRNSNLLGYDYSNINIDDLTSNLVDFNKTNNFQKNNNSIKGMDLGLDINTIKNINSNMTNYMSSTNVNNFKLKDNPYEQNNKKPINTQNVYDFFINNDNNKKNNLDSHKYYAKSPDHAKNVSKNNTNSIFGNNFFSPLLKNNNNINNINQHFKKNDNPIILQSNTTQINNNMPHFDLTKSNNSNNNILNNNNSFKNLSIPNNQISNSNNNINQQGSNMMLFNNQSKNNYKQPIDFSQDYQKSTELAIKIPVMGESSLNNNNNISNKNMNNTNVNNINNIGINNNINNMNNNMSANNRINNSNNNMNNNTINNQKNLNNSNNIIKDRQNNNITNLKLVNLNNKMNNNMNNNNNIMNNSNNNINKNIINIQNNNNMNNNRMNNLNNNLNNNIMNAQNNNNIMNNQNDNIMNNNIKNKKNNNLNNNSNFISNNIPSCSMISNMTNAIYNMQINNNITNQNNTNLNSFPLNQTIYINNSQMNNMNNSLNSFNLNINNNNNNSSFMPNFRASTQTISTIQRVETNNSMFSQDDMSFLSLNKNVKNQKEDYLRLSKNNPEVFGELKEKIYYYMQNNNQIKNIISKGYVGLMIVPKFIINKKSFNLIEIQPQWKDNNIYQNKDFNPNLKKITETTYKIDIINATNAIKFLTYSINQNALNKNHIILPNFNINNNLLLINISYLDNSFKSSIYKVEIEIMLKKGKIINSNGKITKVNDNLYMIIYPNCITESKIQLDNFIISLNNYFKRITVRFEMKGKLRSNNEIKITYNNINSETEELVIQKLTLLSYEFEF